MSAEVPPDAQGAPLRLYVAGDTPGARRARRSRLELIEALHGKVAIEVVDIIDRPDEAEKAGILATPTLSDESVVPPRRLVGDISDVSRVLEFFGYLKKGSAA